MTRRYSIVLGMAAIFREVAVYSGVDENLPTGGQGIVVPSGGSTPVILEDGNALRWHGTPRILRGGATIRRWFLAYLQDQG